MAATENKEPEHEVEQTATATETVAKVNLVSEFNKLADEAFEIGMTGVKKVTRFRDNTTGLKRLEFLRSSVKAWRQGQKAADNQSGNAVQPVPEPPDNTEEADLAKSSTARKTATKSAPKSRVKVAKATKTSKRASDNARKPVKPVVARTGIYGQFETREGTNKEKLLGLLHEKKGKPVLWTDCMKHIYGKAADENRVAFRMVLQGLVVTAEEKKLPWKIETTGRGDEATVTLSAK